MSAVARDLAHSADLIASATAEMRAGHAIGADPVCDPASAVPHILRAWTLLASMEFEDPSVPDGLPEWIARTCAAQGLPTRATRGLVEQVSAWVDAEATRQSGEVAPARVERAAILQNLAVLRMILQLRQAASGGSPPRARTRVWIGRTFAWVALAMGFVLVAVRPWELRRDGQWRGAYYPAEDFRGQPTIRRDRDVAFDWGLEPPVADIPADRFGVRWDSCLALSKATEVAFQLIADDGARLLIDGELVLDNWKEGKASAVGEWLLLPAGVHHILVEYFEATHEASVYLTATFDRNEQPSPIPPHILSYPTSDSTEGNNPCNTP